MPGFESRNALLLGHYSTYVTEAIYERYKSQFRGIAVEMEKYKSKSLGGSYARLGCTPFITMGSTRDFYVTIHKDKNDIDFGLIFIPLFYKWYGKIGE